MDAMLFRHQSLAAKHASALGAVSLASPISHRVWVGASVAAGIIIVLWLLCAHYTRRERVVGTLVPVAGLIKVTAREAGVVAEVFVAEGDGVVSGQPMLRISGERRSEALGDTAKGVTDGLRAQDAALSDEVQALAALAAQQRAALRESAAILDRQVDQFSRQLALSRQQSTSYTSLLERIRPLVKKGYVSQLQIQQQEAQALDAKAQTEMLLRQQADTQRQQAEVRSQLAQLPTTFATKQSELARQRSQIRQAMLEAEANRSITTGASAGGTVSSLLTVTGQSVSAGQPLLAIVPSASGLEAQLLVPSSAVGFVHIGTPVRLHYVAFPYQKFGIQSGRVTQVSKSALSSTEMAMLGGEGGEDHEPRYRVRVALDRQTILAYGKVERLLPGMAVEADLMLDRRTLLEWLLEPLFGARQRLQEASP